MAVVVPPKNAARKRTNAGGGRVRYRGGVSSDAGRMDEVVDCSKILSMRGESLGERRSRRLPLVEWLEHGKGRRGRGGKGWV